MCESADPIVFKNPEHFNNISSRMRTLMLRKQYCDTEITVKSKKYYE